MPVIYKITSPSGKIYIGQTWNWVKRKSSYKRLACSNQRYLYNSLLKYGYENHKLEIICTLTENSTQEEVDNQEIKYCELFKNQEFKLLNIKEPGKGGKNSEETKRKISIKLKGIKVLPESIIKRNETRKLNNYKHSEETCKKIGLKHKGKTISLEMKEAISKKLTGHKMSDKTKICILESLKGRAVSEETRQKISKANLGKKHFNCKEFTRVGRFKKVININTNEIFDNIKVAAEENNIKPYNLVNRLSGLVKNNTSLRLLSNV